MHIELGQRYITVIVKDWQVRIDRRTRLAVSTAMALTLHGLVIWGLIVTHPKPMDLPDFDDDVIEAELYRIEPLPEPVPQRVEVVRPRKIAQAQKQPEPVPVPQPASKPDSEPYKPVPKAAAKPVEIVEAVRAPVLKPVKDAQVQDRTVSVPTLDPDPDPRLAEALKSKKKDKDEALDAKPQLATNSAVSDLNLHETNAPAITAMAPSGLEADKGPSSGKAGGTSGGTSAGGGANGLQGLGLKGRSGVTQALQNHESCTDLQIKGKPIPASCNMKSLSQMKGLGLKPDASLQAEVARKDAYTKYKTSAGNTDYWKRVNAAPSSRYEPPDGSQKTGSYANPKDERVMNGLNTDPKSNIPHK